MDDFLQSFEAWNNLARCYVSLEEYDKAWNIFQEAAKRNYDNWQIWDNVLTISTKCGHFDAVSSKQNPDETIDLLAHDSFLNHNRDIRTRARILRYQ